MPGPPLELTPLADLDVLAPDGVYAPAADSRLIAQALLAEPLDGARVLDLCTGSGYLALTAASAGAEVTAVDLCLHAAEAARANFERNGLEGEVRCGDLTAAVPEGGFDVIVSNPPYVPAERDELPREGPDRAWDAGNDGRAVLDRICAEAPALLSPGGRLLLVHSHVAGVERTVTDLEAAGLTATVSASRRIPFGPVMRSRAAYLTRRGLIAPGEDHEEIVVVRAEREGVA